ncbi:uncharacterized protein L969DRAFT_126052 [Mixia osmundae IAM 14324]|uniref:C-CAP/cofactor C-like domain-containing protein n=1 Tax=Mixia osmundae (strain CBS 9802 / IAM 14324 / JCM 22182 / KY 12970) TaxID=764103 RepID=G7DVA6_MIXOS|nr:uncharacterized protein L969DRAFT_126052 [Mixia osmundae IAM 14324]KEI42061.1 hypothetical protein L969DRAFT_126052 [Mixia osmundae IAM 14324]GAA94516.1 hypothetical protein E5Q_01168 [Mixia osmundae IAM 14324]
MAFHAAFVEAINRLNERLPDRTDTSSASILQTDSANLRQSLEDQPALNKFARRQYVAQLDKFDKGLQAALSRLQEESLTPAEGATLQDAIPVRASAPSRFRLTRNEDPEPKTQTQEDRAAKSTSPIPTLTAGRRRGAYVTFSDCLRDALLSSITLVDLDECFVDLSTAPANKLAGLHLKNLHRCLVFAPDIANSLMLHDCTECLCIVQCQQLRVHTSYRCAFALHSRSPPIIESSNTLVFDGWPLDLSPVMNQTPSKHADVQDFDDPLSTSSTPNWQLATLDNRLTAGLRELQSIGSANGRCDESALQSVLSALQTVK